MSYTLQGGARGALAQAARQRQEFDDANRLLRSDAVSYLQPFFNEAERRHPGQTRNIDKRVKELKEKTIEVMRERLKPLMGDENAEKLVKKVTAVQIKGCYQFARDKEEEELEKKRKVEEAQRRRREQEEEARRRSEDEEKRKRDEAKRDAEWKTMNVNEVIGVAHETTRGSLNATLKKARLLTDKKITLEDVKKWRLENTNKEKKTNRKSYNSWVGNRAKEEYQVDLFYFQDLKKKQALKELLEERAQDDEEAARMEANNIPAPDAIAALPPETNPSPTRKQLLQKIKDLSWEYESGLLVVDTFSKKIAVIPMKNRDWTTIRKALEEAFRRLGGKPGSIYSDAESAMTSGPAKAWFAEQSIVHNITLGHAPVAERMIGVIKSKIVEKLGAPRNNWWTEVGSVVDEYNREHISRSTKMTANEAHQPDNKNEVKTNLESIRKLNNPQPTINKGDEVRVMVKKKFDEKYVPDVSGKTYKVDEKKEWNHLFLHDNEPVDPQTMYSLRDPPYSHYKKRFMRHELLRVK